MKLLFPVDGSECALVALDKLASIVPLFREKPEVVLINVQPPLPHPRATAWVGKEAVAEYYAEESEEALAEARKRLEKSGLAFTVEKRVGEPAHEIVHAAESAKCDMIAMGTRGLSALKNLVMGSVATKVLAVSRKPVLFLT